LVGHATDGLRVMRSTGAQFIDVNAGTFHPVSGSVRAMIVDDFNGDSRADVVTIDSSANVVSWWSGNGAGSFFEPFGVERFNRAIAEDARTVAAGDVDGDGLLDVLIGHSGGGLSLLTNTSLVPDQSRLERS
ncbi:MAG: VCBS repeat-containing protein, partial [Acidobacteria bacterium]|nr:VCBS repeat-containing protein [Acidobacteriota bacterium]